MGQTSSCAPLIHWTNTPCTIPAPAGRNVTGPSAVIMSVDAIASRIFSRSRLPAFVMACLQADTKSGAPHEPGRLRDTRQLRPLIVGRHAVAGHRRGKPALRTEREPLQRDHSRRFLDARAELLDGLDPWLLRRAQSEHNDPILGNGPERLEATRPFVIVFEEEALEPRAAEHARNRLVPSSRVEHRLVVPATDVQPERDARVPGNDGVVHLDAGIDELVWVAASLAIAFAQHRIEECR